MDNLLFGIAMVALVLAMVLVVVAFVINHGHPCPAGQQLHVIPVGRGGAVVWCGR